MYNFSNIECKAKNIFAINWYLLIGELFVKGYEEGRKSGEFKQSKVTIFVLIIRIHVISFEWITIHEWVIFVIPFC